MSCTFEVHVSCPSNLSVIATGDLIKEEECGDARHSFVFLTRHAIPASALCVVVAPSLVHISPRSRHSIVCSYLAAGASLAPRAPRDSKSDFDLPPTSSASDTSAQQLKLHMVSHACSVLPQIMSLYEEFFGSGYPHGPF